MCFLPFEIKQSRCFSISKHILKLADTLHVHTCTTIPQQLYHIIIIYQNIHLMDETSDGGDTNLICSHFNYQIHHINLLLY